MPHGHQRVPVRRSARRCAQRPWPTGQADTLWLGALVPGSPGHGGREPVTTAPAARWVCPQIASSGGDDGLPSRAAREYAGKTLRSWGVTALAEDAAVIVSELVTNALRHGGRGRAAASHGRVELILWIRAGQVVCVVTDPGAGFPVPAPPDPLAEAGRGLHVIEALSARWGWTSIVGRGKAVWAALAMPVAR